MGQFVGELCVAQRIVGVFCPDDVTDRLADAISARHLAIFSDDSPGEEATQLDDTVAGLHVLTVTGTAHRRDMDPGGIGDLLHRECLDLADSIAQEVLLTVDDRLGDVEQRATALIDGMDQPASALDTGADVLGDILLHLGLLEDGGARRRDAKIG